MWESIQFLISGRSHIQVGQAISDVEGQNISFSGDHGLSAPSSDGGVINHQTKVLHLCLGMNGLPSFTFSIVREDPNNGTIINSVNDCSSLADGEGLQSVASNSNNISSSVQLSFKDSGILSQQTTIGTTINQRAMIGFGFNILVADSVRELGHTGSPLIDHTINSDGVIAGGSG